MRRASTDYRSLDAFDSCSPVALVQRRREALKPQISKDYAHLCAQKVNFTDSVFGDDVTKQSKDITDDNKVTHKLLVNK